jgi:hypothetical protein
MFAIVSQAMISLGLGVDVLVGLQVFRWLRLVYLHDQRGLIEA